MSMPEGYKTITTDNRTAGYMPVFGQKKQPSPAASPETFNALMQGAQMAKTSPAATTATAKTAAAGKTDDTGAHENGFLSFIKTIIDVINPLQHIPVISTIYRQLTGDEISPAARVAGDTLYGGPIGTMVALADVTTEQATGKDIGGNVMAMLTGDKGKTSSDTMLASAANTKAAMAASKIEPSTGADNGIIWSTPDTLAAKENPAVKNSTVLASNELPVENVTSLVTNNSSDVADDPAMFAVRKFSLPQGPTTHRNGADRTGPAAASYTAPVLQKKTAVTRPPSQVTTPALLSLQEAPAAEDRKSSASPGLTVNADYVTLNGDNRGLVPQAMMQNLDKYAALKKNQMF